VKYKQENKLIKNKRQVGSHRLQGKKLYQNHDFRFDMVKPVKAYYFTAKGRKGIY